MSYDYDEYQASLAQLLVIDSVSNANFQAILPRIIEYAEGRIYRELDLIATYVEDTSDLVSGKRSVTIPATIMIVHSANLVTPAATPPNAGTRNPMQRSSLEFINFVWPSAGTLGTPQYYAMQTDTLMIVAPTPDAAYKVAVNGPVKPTPLSDDDPETWLTENLPDLFLAASMVYGAGWQRDYGAQADDPKLAQSWEAQYQLLKASSDLDEIRRKAQSVSWQPYQPEPLAKESRT